MRRPGSTEGPAGEHVGAVMIGSANESGGREQMRREELLRKHRKQLLLSDTSHPHTAGGERRKSSASNYDFGRMSARSGYGSSPPQSSRGEKFKNCFLL